MFLFLFLLLLLQIDDAFLEGFHDLVPPELISYSTPRNSAGRQLT